MIERFRFDRNTKFELYKKKMIFSFALICVFAVCLCFFLCVYVFLDIYDFFVFGQPQSTLMFSLLARLALERCLGVRLCLNEVEVFVAVDA